MITVSKEFVQESSNHNFFSPSEPFYEINVIKRRQGYLKSSGCSVVPLIQAICYDRLYTLNKIFIVKMNPLQHTTILEMFACRKRFSAGFAKVGTEILLER